MHWLCLKSFYQTFNMSEISESKGTSSELNIFNLPFNHWSEETPAKFLNDFNSEILQVVTEMVEITSKQLSEECFEKKIKVSSESLHDKQKSDGNKVAVNENDVPVRRSNRIRRSVVRKDEFVTPRPNKKSNKNQRNSEASNQKTAVIESKYSPTHESNKINETSEKVLLDKMLKCKADTKLSKVEVIETSNKILPEKSLKYKSDKKSSKMDKASKKVPQNSRHSVQNEKKKTRKRKNNKIEDSESSSVKNSSISECKNEENTTTLIEPESLALTCAKLLNSVSDSELKTENQISCIKQSKDQTHQIDEQTSDKSVDCCNMKPVKVKSRWWRSSELEAVKNSESMNSDNLVISVALKSEINEPSTADEIGKEEKISDEVSVENENKVVTEVPQDSAPPQYDHIDENIYRFNRRKCKSKKQVRRMVCDCTLTKEEQEYGVMGCKEECLNRLLMIECGSRCPIGEACSNKKFQKKQYVSAEIFKTEKKGWGLRTLENISAGDFLMEFVGEILNHKEYRQRVKQYAKEKNVHCYFMALKTDEILDATNKGNLSRFINHSCNPNCETQKWTVNGELRVGVFAKRSMNVSEELTLDYKFQRYGREAQKCYCGADICSGYIGGAKQISIDAYSGKSVTSRKRKGSEDKKRDGEDMILEEEIEKLNGNRGLRNREDTLKLARLMVRADDSATRHQLLDIILKTEEQACLRLFLDYHGLPLLWSWMTDVMEWDLKAKILQVLSLLPISNKTMLLDSKVMNIVEKWVTECSLPLDIKEEDLSQKSTPAVTCTDETTDSASKKLKITDFSDSETDSTSSHTVVDTSNEMSTAIIDNSSKPSSAVDSISLSEIPKENTCDGKELPSVKEDPNSSFKSNIANLASGLLSNWKNLKEVFRIPRLEQQKRKEDEMEVDNNAKEKGKEENAVDDSAKFGDQIQVVISGKNVFSEHLRAFEYEQQEMKLEECPRRFCQPRAPPVLAKPRHINKPIRPHTYPKMVDKEIPKQKIKEDNSSCSPDILPPMPLTAHVVRPPLLPLPKYTEQPPVAFPPRTNLPPVSLHQSMENTPSPVIFPPQMMYPQPQMPFMGSAAPLHPHNPAAMPPPSVTPQSPSLIQQSPTPVNTNMPPCQPIPASQPNVGVPPNANNFMLPPNVPPPSVMPGPSQFIPNQPAPVQNFPPATSMYSNPGQPLYFIPQQTSLPNNLPPTSFTENIPVQQSSTFPAQPIVPVIKEEPKTIKLPKNWRTATDSEGNVYYYHSVTRQTQWDPPSEDDDSDEEDSNSEESESSDTPTYDEPKLVSSKHSKKKSKRRKPTKAAADTSVAPVRPEIAKKIKELFRTKMSTYIVHCLNAYRRPDCTVGRITSNEDFKYLARKLTHYTMTKELKQCKNVEDLDCNETVMHKAKDFIKKYMAKYGSQYSRKEKCSPAEQ